MNEMQMQQMLRQSKPIKCACGSGLFEPLTALRSVSKLYIPGAGSDLVIPVQVMRCAQCKAINEDFLPEVIPNFAADLGVVKILENG